MPAGAPKGNHNALKHGLYAKYFTKEDLKKLNKMPINDLIAEILTTRLVISRILEGFVKADTFAYSAAIASLVTVVNSHAMLTGTYTPLMIAFEETLDYVPPYTNTESPVP